MKKFLISAGVLLLLCVILLAGIWLKNPWVSTVLTVLVAVFGGLLLLHMWKKEKEMETARRGFKEDLELMKQEKEKCRKSCVEDQARFYSVFSHGIRMPLSIIKGYAELLVSGDVETEDETEYLQKIIQKCQVIEDFFPKVQDKLEMDELDIEERSAVDLLKVTQECIQDIQNSMSFKPIRFQILSQEEEVCVWCNQARINEIIYNLIDNSSKYMQRPGIVTIRFWKENGMAHLVVRDDGMGLAKEETEHIFEKDYQGSNRKRGRGYGLYWVKKIILAYQGEISADSDLGKGMAIHIVLPEFRQDKLEKQLKAAM